MKKTGLNWALALLLALVLIICLAPAALAESAPRTASWTLQAKGPEGYTISLYAVGSETPLATFGYSQTAIQLPASEATYTYKATDISKADCGSGEFRVTGNNQSLELCTVDFSRRVENEDEKPYRMAVTRDGDESLQFVPSAAKPGLVILPKLKGDGFYHYRFVPLDSEGQEDTAYWGSYGEVWVYKDTEFARFNLSDAGKFVIAPRTQMSIEVPHGSTLRLCHRNQFYLPLEYLEPKSVTEGAQTDTYTYDVPKNTTLHYELEAPGYVMSAHTFTTSAYENGTLSLPASGLRPVSDYYLNDIRDETQADRNASIISNLPSSKCVEMKQGEYFDLYLYRDWQAINSGTGNYYVDPHFHYDIISGDSVTLSDEYYAGIRINAVKPGVSIIRVTYDAMEFDGTLYSKLWEENTLTAVINVGGSGEGIKTGIAHTEGETVYYTKTLSGKEIEGAMGSYSFTPSVDAAKTGSSKIEVATHTPVGSKGVWKEEDWKTQTPDENGKYTISLRDGGTVVRVSSGSKVAYHTIRAKGIGVNILNETTGILGGSVTLGDRIAVSFEGLTMPVPKLGAIYNPGFPDHTFLVYDLNGEKTESSHTQYEIASVNTIRFTATASGVWSLTGGKIHTDSIGSSTATHTKMTRGGLANGTGYVDGSDNGVTIEGLFSIMPDLHIVVRGKDDADLSKRLNYFKIIAKDDNPVIQSNEKTLRYDSVMTGKEFPRNSFLMDPYTNHYFKETDNFLHLKSATSTNYKENTMLLRYWTEDSDTIKGRSFVSGKQVKTEPFYDKTDVVNFEIVIIPKDGVDAFSTTYATRLTDKDSKIPALENMSIDTGAFGDYCSPIEGKLKSKPVTYVDTNGETQTVDLGYGFLLTEHDYTCALPYEVENFKVNAAAHAEGNETPTTKLTVEGKAQSFDDPIAVEPGETVDVTVACTLGSETRSYTVAVTRAEKPAQTPVQEVFTDLGAHWGQDAIQYVYDNGLMNGMKADVFGPDVKLDRSQLVTILWRMEGSPTDVGGKEFQDVSKTASNTAWFYDAVSWASANGIVNGKSETTFDPFALVTREQAAAMFHRYAAFKDKDSSQRADLSKYADAGKISSWAKDDLAWANQVGLINGQSATKLAPLDGATRTEAATILMRFCEQILK